jgi:hypothetical protein
VFAYILLALVHTAGSASSRYTPAPVGVYSPGVGSADEPDMHSVMPPEENTLAEPWPDAYTFSLGHPSERVFGAPG